MKEVTYGWYPSAHDVYRSKGRPSSYHLECLYKYKDSLYYQGQVDPPQSELIIRGIAPSPVPTPQEVRRLRAKTVSVPKFTPVPKLNIPTPTQCWATSTQKGTTETTWGVVGDGPGHTMQGTPGVSWPLPKKKQQHQQRLNLQYSPQPQSLKERIERQQEKYYGQGNQSPQLAWGFQRAQTARESSACAYSGGQDLKWPKAQDVRPERPKTSSTPQTPKSPKQSQTARPSSSPVRSPSQNKYHGHRGQPQATPTPPQATRTPASARPARIQSATIRRDKTPMPMRPMTAMSTRSPRNQFVSDEAQDAILTISARPEIPQAPAVPFIYDVNEAPPKEEEEDDDGVLWENTSLEDNYDDMVKKHGWRAEVHGDPYKLKRPMPRLKYAVECTVPDVPPEPPRVHMETNEPFFLNTIPNKPMVFAVDKEWMSEVLLAKRLELQKRDGGIKYSYKNFSFVY